MLRSDLRFNARYRHYPGRQPERHSICPPQKEEKKVSTDLIQEPVVSNPKVKGRQLGQLTQPKPLQSHVS